jgi:hypothetical protein
VVHQVGDARDAAGREGQRLDQLGLRARRRREDALVVVGVVGDPHGHAARRGLAQRPGHQVARLAGQAHVVEGEVERAARVADEGRDPSRHVQRALAPRVEGRHVDGVAIPG